MGLLQSNASTLRTQIGTEIQVSRIIDELRQNTAEGASAKVQLNVKKMSAPALQPLITLLCRCIRHHAQVMVKVAAFTLGSFRLQKTSVNTDATFSVAALALS